MFKKLSIITILSVSLFSLAFAQEDEGPMITIKPMAQSVEPGKVLKLSVSSNQALLRFAQDMVSIDGGNVESVRKLSSYSYLIFVRAGADSRVVDVQIEAGAVQNKAQVYNAYSSNSVEVPVSGNSASEKQQAATNGTLSKILDTLNFTAQQNAATQAQIKAVQQQQVTPIQTQAQPQVQYYMCNGYQIPTTQPCQQAAISPYGMQQQAVYDPISGTYYNPVTGMPVANPYITTTPYSPYSAYGTSNLYNPYPSTYIPGTTPYTTTYYDDDDDDDYVYTAPARPSTSVYLQPSKSSSLWFSF